MGCGDPDIKQDYDKFNGGFVMFITKAIQYLDLRATMSKFAYTKPPEEVIKDNKKQVDLVQTSTINNCSPGTLIEEVSNTVKKTQSLKLSISPSVTKSAKFFSKFTIPAEISAKFLGMGESVSTSLEFGYEIGQNSTNNKDWEQTATRDVTYSVKKTVNVPPDQCFKIASYVNWIENPKLPYKALIDVTVMKKSGGVSEHEESRNVLKKMGFDEKFVNETTNSLVYETSGEFTGSFGLDSMFSVSKIGQNCKCEEKDNDVTYYDVKVHYSPTNIL